MSANQRPPWDGHSALAQLSTIGHSAFCLAGTSQPCGLLGYLPETNSLPLPLLGPVPERAIIAESDQSPEKIFKWAASITDSRRSPYKFPNPYLSKPKRYELHIKRTQSSCSPQPRKAFNEGNGHTETKVSLQSFPCIHL